MRREMLGDVSFSIRPRYHTVLTCLRVLAPSSIPQPSWGLAASKTQLQTAVTFTIFVLQV